MEGGKHLLAHSVNTECATISLRLRQGEVLHASSCALLEVPHLESEFACIGHQLEESSAQGIRLNGSKHVAPFVHHEALSLMRMPVVIHSQHCHAALLPRNQVTALGVELHADGLQKVTRVDAVVYRLLVERVIAGAVVRVTCLKVHGADGQVGVVTLLLRCLEDGEHP